MKAAIIVLAALNLVLLAVWSGVLGALVGDAREPDRLARQVRPEQLRIVKAEAASAAMAPSRPPASPPLAVPPSALPPSTVQPPDVSLPSAPPTASSTAPAPASPAVVTSPAPASSSETEPACIEWGPFPESALATARAAAEALALRAEPIVRVVDVTSYQVYLPPLEDEAAAQARTARLRQAGIASYVIARGAHRGGWSLGVFRREQGAQALMQTMHARGLDDARIAERGTEQWLLRLHGPSLPAQQRRTLSSAFPASGFEDCPG